jgi:hypothetical protein
MDEVECWFYNIQDIETDRQYDQLVGSHFDMYVIEMLSEIKNTCPCFAWNMPRTRTVRKYTSRVYKNKAPKSGFIPYCTQRSLSRLSKTRYP